MLLSTRLKILIARILSSVVRGVGRLFGVSSQRVVTRSGVRWALDLNQGVDFSIYLLGAFEPSTVRAIRRLVHPGMVCVDIGANIGAHTLPLASLSEKVIAIEPTDYAFGRLMQNIELNPEIASRILPLQVALIGEREESGQENAFYAQWSLKPEPHSHGVHFGNLCSAQGARYERFDDLFLSLNLSRLDFVKIDVDGHEVPVLRGAKETLRRFRPILLIELCPYVHDEHGFSFGELLTVLREFEYELYSEESDRKLPEDERALRRLIPEGGGINAIGRMRP